MPSCEKCWSDALLRMMNDTSKLRIEHYKDILIEKDHKPCSPKEQAGEWWDEEKQSDSRNRD